MNKADINFNCIGKQILQGSTVEKTRATWEDGKSAGTRAVFFTKTDYDLATEFPISQQRKQYWKNAIREMLWIHQQHSNNVNDLGLKIWDQWADENGSIGKAYGYQAGLVYEWEDTPEPMTQVERVLYLLKHNPASRRMYITFINNKDITKKNLQECLHTVEFTVLDGKLHMVAYQRSGDFLVASGPGGYNEIQYAALQLMIAHCSGFEPGTFVHTVVNHHIYDRHLETTEDLVHTKIPTTEMPRLYLDTDEKRFFKIKLEDFRLENYNFVKDVKGIEVAE